MMINRYDSHEKYRLHLNNFLKFNMYFNHN